MIFFFDENIIEHVARILAAFDREHEMRHAVDHFERGTPDTEWIPAVALWKGDPVAVCADGRILRNKVERKVLKDSGLMFVYTWHPAGQTRRGWTTPGKSSKSGPRLSGTLVKRDTRWFSRFPWA